MKEMLLLALAGLLGVPGFGGAPLQTSKAPLVYIAEITGQIAVYDETGKPIAVMHSKSMNPWGVAVDPAGHIYSVAIGGYHGPHGSITVFPRGNGQVRPLRKIKCGVVEAWGGVVNARGDLLVTDPASSAVVTYGPHADGCATPKSVLSGPSVGLGAATGIALDAQGRIYVSAGPRNFISVHAAGAHGNAPPIATIYGAATGLGEPEGVALDARGNIYASNYDIGTVTEYAAGANGNVSPIRTIAGPATGLQVPLAIAVSKATGEIYVADYGTHAILVFAANANGNAAPIRRILGDANDVTVF